MMLFGHFFVFLQLFSYLNYVWLSKNTNMLTEKALHSRVWGTQHGFLISCVVDNENEVILLKACEKQYRRVSCFSGTSAC